MPPANSSAAAISTPLSVGRGAIAPICTRDAGAFSAASWRSASPSPYRENSMARTVAKTPFRESIIHRRCLIAGVQHAVGALGIAGFITGLLPGGGIQQFLKRVGVAILEEIAGLLPTENAVSRHTPRRAVQVAFPHEELQEQRGHVE